MVAHPTPFKAEVFALLNKYSPEAANVFNRMFHHPARVHHSRALQISDVNTFWRTQLALVGPTTLTARQSLIDGISSVSWLMFFERDLIPVIIQCWLPNVVTRQ